jgi:ATP-dependent protease ClpP protease subunit
MADNVFEAKKVEEGHLTRLDLHLKFAFEYGANFRDRIITLDREIDSGSFTFVSAALTEMEKTNKRRVTLHINSPGGSVYDALAIVGRLKASPCNIITEIYGQCMSAATLIAACGSYRRMSRYAFFMHHQSTYGFSGKHEEAKVLFEQQEREERSWANWMAEFSKMDDDFWYQIVKSGDVYYSPEECLKLGLIDEII